MARRGTGTLARDFNPVRRTPVPTAASASCLCDVSHELRFALARPASPTPAERALKPWRVGADVGSCAARKRIA